MKTIAVVIGVGSLSLSSLFGYLYDFSGSNVFIGGSATFTSGGVTITAYGYQYNHSQPANLGTLTSLYEQNNGGDEVGLGIVTSLGIGKNQFVQLNLSNLLSTGVTTISLGIGGVQEGGVWGVYQSSTLGLIGTAIPGFGSGTTGYPTLFTLPISAVDPYISITDTGSGNNQVTVAELSAPSPEPATYLGLASFLGLAGLIGRRRRYKCSVSRVFEGN